jgi:MFS family permease
VLKRLERTYFALFREYPALINLAVITGAGQMAFALINIYALPVYLNKDLHLSGLALGATATTFLAFETVFKFPMGRLSDHYGRKPFVVLGPLLICLNPALVVNLPARLWLLVFPLRAADGAGGGALWPPLFAMIGDLVRSRSRAAAMAVASVVYGSGSALGVLVGAVVTHLTGSNRAPFYVATCLFAFAAATGYFGLPRLAHSPEEPPDPAASSPPTCAAEPSTRTAYPLILALLISGFMVMAGMTLASFIILYLRELGLSRLDLIVLVIVLGGPAALLALPLGHAADRQGKPLAVRIFLIVSALMMWLMPLCRTVVPLALVGGVLVVSIILGIPAWLALVSDLAPTSRRGGLMGIVTTAEGIGAVLGPLLGGWLWDIRHHYIFYGAAALLTLAALVAAITLRGKPPRAAPPH